MKICRIIPDQQNNWPKHHVACYLATNGADGYWADFTAVGGPAKAPNLILTVTGRRSGKSYTLGLIYGDIDGSYVIIGSRGGAHEHPAWYLNLVANPVVQVQIKGRKFQAQARVTTGDERAVLWEMMSDRSGGYVDVQKNTDREFPVVVLEPVPS